MTVIEQANEKVDQIEMVLGKTKTSELKEAFTLLNLYAPHTLESIAIAFVNEIIKSKGEASNV